MSSEAGSPTSISPFNCPRSPIFTNKTSIDALPDELLTRVFLCTDVLPDFSVSPFLLKPDQSFYKTPTSTCTNQVTLSHVCRRWRRITLNTTILWTPLRIDRLGGIARSKEYLNRCSSSSLPIDIYIDTVGVEDHRPGVNICRDHLHCIFDSILPYISRWRTLFLKVRDNDCRVIALTRLSTCGPAPILETFQMYHFDEDTPENLLLATQQRPTTLFDGSLPNLRNFSLIGVHLSWSKAPYLRNLKSIDLALHAQSVRPTYDEWETVFRNCPDLESLSLHYSGPYISPEEFTPESVGVNWPPNREPIVLRKLQDVNLVDLGPDYIYLVFEHLYMPNVKRLGLDLPEQDYTLFVNLLSGAKRRSIQVRGADDPLYGPPGRPIGYFEKVEHLAITSLQCSTAAWLKFIPSIREMRIMEIDWKRMADDFYDALWTLVDEKAPSVHDTLPTAPTNATPNDSDSDSETAVKRPRKQRVRLLPRMEEMRISGLSGERVNGLISYSQTLGCTVKRWVVDWDAEQKGRDKVLDTLVERGWTQVYNGTDQLRFKYYQDNVEGVKPEIISRPPAEDSDYSDDEGEEDDGTDGEDEPPGSSS